MLIDERFILLFLDCYFNRAIANDGNNFQWKTNVAIRSFATFCRVLPPCFLLPASSYSVCPVAVCPVAVCPVAVCQEGGGLPFFKKNRFFIPPPKNSRHFFKKVIPPYHI